MAQCAGFAILRRFVSLLSPLNTFKFHIVPVSVSIPYWASPSILPRMKKIPLSQGKEALVDDEDYEWLMEWKWSYLEPGYATRYELKGESEKESRLLYMERIVWEYHQGPIGKGLVINFKNENGLDNRLRNLRLATHAQAIWTQKARTGYTSEYKGVWWHKKNEKWISRIRRGGKQLHLGYFENEKEAARAYNKAALKYFGEYAWLNEIED